jgi:uncharacterized membrane protein YvbJ
LKTCTYCGAQNEDTAAVCAVCATQLLAVDSSTPQPFLRVFSDPVARFRIVVILSTVCYLLYLFGPWVFWRNLSDETYNARPLKNGFGECERSFGEFKFDEAG